MMYLALQFILALFATCGFSIIFQVPLRHIPPVAIVGGLGWVCYQITIYYDSSPVIACFIAACLVGFLSDICSRIFKEASTIFTIPGILCLVPGAGMFYTMKAFLDHDTSDLTNTATETLLMAGAIAAGLLVIGSLIKIIRSIIRKTVAKTKDITRDITSKF